MKNFVMGAKIAPKVVKDLSVFKNWWMEHSTTQSSKLLEDFINENEPRLSIRIQNRHPFFMIQYLERPFVCDNPNVKETKPNCEDLHEMMHCFRQHHFAACNDLQEHPRKHSLWKDSMKDGTVKDAIRIGLSACGMQRLF